MARFLNLTAGLIYLLWLVIGGLHAAVGPRAVMSKPNPVLAGSLR